MESLRETFNLLKTSLIDPNPDPEVPNDPDPDEPMNPYKYIVNTAMVNAINDADGVRTFTLNGKVVAIVTTKDFTICEGDGYDDLLIVVSAKDKNVTVSRDFTGLVISGGNIVIKQDVEMKADPTPVAAAFAAKNGDETFRDYLRHGADEIWGENLQINTDGWNLDGIVTYNNWNKN